MANQVDLASLLYAYALGCLDKEDYIRLMEYFESGADYPWQELGEYQNLAALLPSFLDVEEVNPAVKDKVARKLYRLRDFRRTQQGDSGYVPPAPALPAEPEYTAPPAPAAVPVPEPSPAAMPRPEFTPAPPASEEPMADFRPVTPPRPVAEDARPAQDTQIRGRVSRPDSPQDRDKQEPAAFYMPPAPEPEPEPGTVSDPGPVPFVDEETQFGYNDPGFTFPSQPPKPDEPQSESGFNFTLDLPQDAGALPDAEPPLPAAPEYNPTVTMADSELERIRREVVLKAELEAKSQQAAPPVAPVDSGISKAIFLTTVIVLIAGMVAIYFFLNGAMLDRIKKVELNQASRIEAAKLEVRNSLNASQDVLTILAEKDVRVSILAAYPVKNAYYGKFIYSIGQGRGYLQVANLPKPEGQRGYQLWVTLNGQAVPIGQPFLPDMNVEYIPVGTLPDVNSVSEVTLLVTEEPITGSAAPGSKRVLTGSM